MKKLFFLAVFVLIITLQAFASFITLETTVTPIGNSTFLVIKNNGDEPAYNLQVIIDYPDYKFNSKVYSKLEVNHVFNESFPITDFNLLPGTYPLIITINYQDANSYPFSAVSTTLLNNKEFTNPGLVLSTQPIKLSGSNKVKVLIKNLDEKEKKLSLRIITPKELTVEGKKDIAIAAKGQESVSFKVEDFSARQDSSYAIFAIAEYEEAGKHYTSIASSNIRIVKKIGPSTTTLIISLIILASILVMYRLFKKRNQS